MGCYAGAARTQVLAHNHDVLFSDRLKSSGSVSGSESSTPYAAAGHSQDFQDFQASNSLGSGSVMNSACHANNTSDRTSALDNGVPVAKKCKISIQVSSSNGGSYDPFTSDAVKKVAPSTDEVLALAIEIKRNIPGCGVRKVLSQMLEKHPDWAISEHRVDKLLHDHGLANVKKPPSTSSNSGDIQQLSAPPEPSNSKAAVSDVHFDILSLPQPQTASAALEFLPPASNSTCSPIALPCSSLSAEMVDLDKLFTPFASEAEASSGSGGPFLAAASSTVDAPVYFSGAIP
jgi:hypothetical protein